MKARTDADFAEYVAASMTSLRRLAFMLCHDWHRADDLVQATVTRLYVRWARAQDYSAAVAIMCVPDADGLGWLLEVFQRRVMDVVPLFEHHMRLLGPDPARWTTRPIG